LDIANTAAGKRNIPGVKQKENRDRGIRVDFPSSRTMQLEIQCTRSILSLGSCANANRRSRVDEGRKIRREIVGSVMESIWRSVILRYPIARITIDKCLQSSLSRDTMEQLLAREYNCPYESAKRLQSPRTMCASETDFASNLSERIIFPAIHSMDVSVHFRHDYIPERPRATRLLNQCRH